MAPETSIHESGVPQFDKTKIHHFDHGHSCGDQEYLSDEG
jgi:hypothetical protein